MQMRGWKHPPTSPSNWRPVSPNSPNEGGTKAAPSRSHNRSHGDDNSEKVLLRNDIVAVGENRPPLIANDIRCSGADSSALLAHRNNARSLRAFGMTIVVVRFWGLQLVTGDQ